MWSTATGACLRDVHQPRGGTSRGESGMIIPRRMRNGGDSSRGTLAPASSTIHRGPDAPVGHASWSPNDRYVLVSTLDDRVRLIDAVTGETAKTMRGHRNDAFCCFSRVFPGSGGEGGGGLLLGGGGDDGERRGRDPKGPEEGPEGPEDVRTAAALVVSGGDGGVATVWDLQTREVLARLGDGVPEGGSARRARTATRRRRRGFIGGRRINSARATTRRREGTPPEAARRSRLPGVRFGPRGAPRRVRRRGHGPREPPRRRTCSRRPGWSAIRRSDSGAPGRAV